MRQSFLFSSSSPFLHCPFLHFSISPFPYFASCLAYTRLTGSTSFCRLKLCCSLFLLLFCNGEIIDPSDPWASFHSEKPHRPHYHPLLARLSWLAATSFALFIFGIIYFRHKQQQLFIFCAKQQQQHFPSLSFAYVAVSFAGLPRATFCIFMIFILISFKLTQEWERKIRGNGEKSLLFLQIAYNDGRKFASCLLGSSSFVLFFNVTLEVM